MAAIKLNTRAIEKSTYIVTASFYDSSDNAITPTSVTWSLVDLRGRTINSRKDVEETPDTSVAIVLSGDDLTVASDTNNQRLLIVKAVYDSDDYGEDLTLNARAVFEIEPLVSV